MRQLYINGVLAMMPPGAGIPYEKLNPAFNELGSHSMDFLILLTDEIKIALGWPHRITSTLKTTATVVLKFSDADFIKGTLIVKTTTNGKTAQCYMGSEEGDFYMQGQKINMRDIDFGTDVTLGTTAQQVADLATARVSQSYPATNFNFPIINNSEFYGTGGLINPAYNNLMNGGWNAILETFQINTISESPTGNNFYTLVPFLYLFFVISKLLYHLNFKPLGSFWTNSDLKKMLLYNNYPLDWNEKKYYVKATSLSDQQNNPGDFGLYILCSDDYTNPPNEDSESIWTGNNYLMSINGYITVKATVIVDPLWTNFPDSLVFQLRRNVNDIVDSQIVYFSNTSITTVNIELHYYAQTADFGHGLSIYVQGNTSPSIGFIIKAGTIISVNNDSYCALNQFAKSLHYTNHVPDMPVGEFMKQIELILGHVSFIDNIRREHRLMSYNAIFNGNVINDITTNVLEGMQVTFETLKTLQGFLFDNDNFTENNFLKYSDYEFLGDYILITDLPTPIQEGKIARVLQTNKIYITKYDVTTNSIDWIFFTDDFFDLSTGNVENQETDLRPSAAPMLMDVGPTDTYYNLIPEIKNMATSPSFNTGTNDMPLRLMFYFGLTLNTQSYNYPFASSLKYDANGNIIGNFNLTIADINEQFLSKYITWLTTEHKPIIFNAIFTSRQIRDLKMWEKFEIKIDGNSITGFIKRISTNIFADHLDICEVEFLPI